MREAEWTPSPHVERDTALLRRRSRWEGSLGVWVAGASCVTALGFGSAFFDALARGATLEASVCALVALASATLVIGAAIRDSDLAARVEASDRDRRGELGRGVGWLVDLVILQGSAPTGTDRGMLWIEGDRLCFSGDRTSFALSSDQIAGRCEKVIPVTGLRHATRLPLMHRTAAGRLGLSVRPDDLDHDGFRRAIDRWASAKSKSTGGQLPPTRVGPGAISLRRLFSTAAFVTAYWSLATAFVVSTYFRNPALSAAMLVLSLALGGLLRGFPLTLRWRAFCDRPSAGGEVSEDRADWRPQPGHRAGLADDRRRERRRRWNVGIMLIAGLGVGPFACFGTCLTLGEQGGGVGGLLSLAFAAILAFGFGAFRYAKDAARGRARHLALVKEFSEVAGVDRRDDDPPGEIVSGRDTGTVWFDAGRLYFTGARTSFGLGPGDVRGKVLKRDAVLDPSPHLVLPLRADSTVGPVALGLRLTSPEVDPSGFADASFRKAVRRWVAAGGTTRGQLPPPRPRPRPKIVTIASGPRDPGDRGLADGRRSPRPRRAVRRSGGRGALRTAHPVRMAGQSVAPPLRAGGPRPASAGGVQ